MAKKLEEIKEEECPYELPKGWKWERLGNVTKRIKRGKSPKYTEKSNVYALMEKTGYNSLNLYDFIKHLSDKRGAHIDVGTSILISIFNKPGKDGYTLVECLALQMILAAEKQVPELSDYWPESLEIVQDI